LRGIDAHPDSADHPIFDIGVQVFCQIVLNVNLRPQDQPVECPALLELRTS
jgi:hypothetical protein